MVKILVPTDFSAEATYAMDVAYEIASQHNQAQITLLHIIETPAPSSFNTIGEYVPENNDYFYVVKLVEKAKHQLNEIVTERRFKGIPIVPAIKVGNAFKAISEEISSVKVDLIVMGTKGASGIDELLVGSNAEKVVRLANCPVITVRNKPTNFRIRNIVFASDFKENMESLSGIKDIQQLFFSKLHLLYVNTPSSFETSDVITKRMQKFVKDNSLDDVTYNIFNSNSEEEGICSFSESIQADLIAIATHGRRGFMHLLMGSITESLVNHSKTMVFSFKINQNKSKDVSS